MSVIKSFSVGNGDTFYIRHGSDSFTMIDCHLSDFNQKRIISELKTQSSDKGIKRFISTHPDEDHIRGLKLIDQEMPIVNFYCVKNRVTKENESPDFIFYRKLREDTEKTYHLSKDCVRKWLNDGSSERSSAGLQICWPNVENAEYKKALAVAESGGSPNNTSAVIRYSLNNGCSFLWMGDLETAFMEAIVNDIELKKTDIVFAAHHGRASGRVPSSWLKTLDPQVIVLGEADSIHLNYYQGFNTITQNSAGDITFDCGPGYTDLFVSEDGYSADFLNNSLVQKSGYGYYIGSLNH
ncbi:MAG: hypothetical protein KDD52_01660 [Bdellovibrionales bacterium]|nr:hypothetical protein [Bdellovibrionales bacterium]